MGDTANGRKSKLIETLWLFWAFHLVGFVNGIIGPTLLDLQLIAGSTMTQMTYIFFVQGAGFIAGILLACVFEKCASTRLIMTCSLLVGCIVNFALPWATHFYYLAVMFFILGLAKGLVDYAALSICNQLWQDNKSIPFQFITLGAGIASFLAPFLATPFLAHPHSSRSVIATGFGNHTSLPPFCTGTNCPKEESRVQYAYVIIGILCLPPVVAFAHYHRERTVLPLITYEQFAEITEKPKYSPRECLFVFLIFLFHVPVFGIMLTYSDLLAPFGVEIDSHLSKSRMAVITSVFWGSFLAGRVLNLFFSGCLPTFILLCLNFVGWIASCIVLFFLAEKEEVGLWMGTAALGVFSAPYLPMVLAWCSERMYLTGELITASLVASGIGEIFVPFVTGQFFTVYGPRFLIYSICGAVLYEVVTFILLAICARGVMIGHQTRPY